MSCVVKNCKNYKKKKIEGISFHRLPQYGNVLEQWRRILNLEENFQWSQNKLICSKHFDASDIYQLNPDQPSRTFLKPSAVPLHFLDNSGIDSSSNAVDISVETNSSTTKEVIKKKSQNSNSSTARSEKKKMILKSVQRIHNYVKTPESLEKQLKIIKKKKLAYCQKLYRANRMIKKLRREVTCLKSVIDQLTDENYVCCSSI